MTIRDRILHVMDRDVPEKGFRTAWLPAHDCAVAECVAREALQIARDETLWQFTPDDHLTRDKVEIVRNRIHCVFAKLLAELAGGNQAGTQEHAASPSASEAK